jgi:Ca2+-binding EF-hand superfamily protein
MTKIKPIFERYDASKTGTLSKVELKQLLQELETREVTDDEVAFVLRMADKRPPEGELGMLELMDALKSWQCYMEEFSPPDSFGNRMFEKYDTDRTGKLSREQLKNLLVELNEPHPVSEEDVDWVMGKADMLGDGQIHKMEFLQAHAAWFQKQSEQQAEADVAIYEMERFINRIKRVNQSGDTPEQEAKHQEKVKKAEEAFEQIKASRKKLAEDLQYKARALKIDEACKILTLTKVPIEQLKGKKKVALGRGEAGGRGDRPDGPGDQPDGADGGGS